MKDGLYIVDRNNIYAAFVVRDGHITNCAPILRAKLEYWSKVAKWVPTEGEPVATPAHHNGHDDGDYPPPWREGCT